MAKSSVCVATLQVPLAGNKELLEEYKGWEASQRKVNSSHFPAGTAELLKCFGCISAAETEVQLKSKWLHGTKAK
jgi:hypothetical protein